MKRISTRLALTLVLSILIGLPEIAVASVTPASTGLEQAAKTGGLSSTCSGLECVATTVGNAISIVLGFVGIVLLIVFIYAGFLWMTAGGEKDNVTQAKQLLLNAVAGAIIVAASFAISTFVLKQLATITGGGSTEEVGASGVPNGGVCTESRECTDPLATCTDGVCTPI